MTIQEEIMGLPQNERCDECGDNRAVVRVQHGEVDPETGYLDEEMLCARCAEGRSHGS